MRNFLSVFFVVLIILVFLELWLGFPITLDRSDKKAESTEVDKSNAADNFDRKMQGVHLVESREGNQDWELFAETAVGTEGKGTWELQEVKVNFFSEKGVNFTVTGKTGKIDTNSKNMEIYGSVVTRSTNGYKFESPSMKYISADRILRSLEDIKMTGPSDQKGKGLILKGREMEAYVEQSLMKIRQNVKATKQLSDGRTFRISSVSAEFSGKSNSAKFTEQVSIELDSMKMEGPEAQFQYGDNTDFLKSILVRGGVRVSDIDKYATSDTVKFDPIENKYVLVGNPRVIQDNDEILGEEITLIDGGRKVRVDKIRARVEKLDGEKQ